MKAIVNIGLVLQRIREKGCSGFSDAAALCRTNPNNFKKLSRGELPRLDALQRICRGLGITEQELILGITKPKPAEPAEVVGLKEHGIRLIS
jgi:hypothetical protein